MWLRRHLPIMIVVAAIATACASIMGLEEAELDTPTQPNADGAPPGSNDGGIAKDAEPIFDPDTGCVGKGCPCIADKDCLDPLSFKICVEGKCGVCTTAPKDSCPAGRLCAPPSVTADGGTIGANAFPNNVSNECIPGCKTDDECKSLTSGAAPFCRLDTRQCVACLEKSHCPGSQVCSASGKCADPCTNVGGDCSTAGQKCCNTAQGPLCIGVKDDPLNCDACGNACPGGNNARCCNGTCENIATSENACGSCGNPCSRVGGTPSCTNGNCTWTCGAGLAHCQDANSGCETNIATNTEQCGSCTTNCNARVRNAQGVSCAGGRCDYGTCLAGFANCNGDDTDGCECPCGGNGQVCCSNGAPCASGALICAGNNRCRPCGASGEPCCAGDSCTGASTICRGGTCVPCGGATQPCCAGQPACTTPLLCIDGSCTPCKDHREGPCIGVPGICCSGLSCNAQHNDCR